MARSGPGPWFPARFDSECGDPIDEGDTIRADGEGGYVCEPCGEDLDDDRIGEVHY